MTGRTISLAVTSFSLVLNGAIWIIVFAIFPRQEVAAVLHYNIDVGIDFIGEGKQIIILPIVGLLVLIGNSTIGLAVHKVQPTASWVLIGIVSIAQCILLGAFLLIYRANA